MGEFARDIADDQFGLDRKLPRTLNALFFKPGLLTREYMAGRIVRYIPPFRLYLISSVVFFVLLSFLSRQSDWAERAGREIQRGIAADSARAAGVPPDTSAADNGAKVESTAGGAPWYDSTNVRINTPSESLNRKIKSNLNALSRMPPNVAMRMVTDSLIEELPKAMFLLLPVFALLLKLLYVRRKRFYIEHFVFSLHFHAFAFALFTIVLVTRFDMLFMLAGIAIVVYLLVAMKRVYEQGAVKTFLKWLVLGYVYFMLVAIGTALAMVWALASTTPTG